MSSELAFIEALRALAATPAARGLRDDAAVLELGGETLVLTMDTLVEGVHYLPDDPAATVAWKLVAVNASDLSAKGAEPLGCLYSHALGEDGWDRRFLAGLAEATAAFRLPLLGGDTVRMPQGAPRAFSLTALGRPPRGTPVPSRGGAREGDRIWVSGTLGDAGLGLELLTGRRGGDDAVAAQLVDRYRRPRPDPALGPAIAGRVHAMMDVSDGLLVDARRMAEASGVEIVIDAAALPLSAAFRALAGDDLSARLGAATAGDDYCLLFAAPPAAEAELAGLAARSGVTLRAVGHVVAGTGLALRHEGRALPLPDRLGYEH